MKQTPILLVVAGVALGILAWNRFSGSSWVPLDESGRAVSDSDEEQQLALEDGADSASAAARARRSGAQAGGGSGSPFREKRIGRDLGASGGADRSSGGSAAAYSSGSRDRKGKIGVSASGRPSDGDGSGASLSARGTGSDRGLGDERPERSADVRDFLSQQAGSQPRAEAEEDLDDPADENSEVVFKAPLNREFGTETTEGPPPLVEQDLNVDDSGDGIKFGKDSVLAFPDAGNVKNDAGTITFEFEPDWEGGEDGDYNFVNVRTPNDPRNLLRVYKNGRYLRFLFADDTGRERNIGYDMVDMEPGERHRVTASWGDNQTALYVDNQLVGTNTYEGQLNIPPGTPLYLGSDVPQAGPSGAGATISNFEIYGRTLAGDEVSGLPIGQAP